MSRLDIRKILIPTDFSETAEMAVQHAVHLAKLIHAEIMLLHVVSTYAFRVNLPEVEVDETQNARISGAVGVRLAKQVDQIKQEAGVVVNYLISSGRIREEVCRIAEEVDADLIILGTHGVSGLKEFFMGSNAFRIVSEAHCPVLSIQSQASVHGYKNIVVPIDNSFHSREKLGISLKIAQIYGAKLLVCGLRSHDHNDQDLNAKFRMKLKQVEDFIKEREVEFEIEMVFCSNIAKATMDFAASRNADLIVIMNEQEINDTGFFLGPYAQQVVNHSKIPVLSIRPTQGNVSMVTPY